MVPRAQDTLERVRSDTAEKRLLAIKEVKNQIIGNKKRKISYVQLGAVGTLLELLHSPDAALQLRSEVLDTLSSFSYSQPGLQALLDGGGLPVLQQALDSGQLVLQKAGMRSLERLLASPELQVILRFVRQPAKFR